MVNRYRSFLRVSMAVVAVTLVFDSGLLFPITKQLSDTTLSYVANVSSGVGATASVSPNEINVLTAQITAQKNELDAREASLREREIASREFNTSTTDYSTYIMSVILFILTVLVVLNFAMDWSRMRSLRYGK